MPQSLMTAHKKYQRGFTLIEIAITLIILGLLVGATFAFYNPIMEGKRIQVTHDRQLKIARAMSSYVQLHGVLPCPALPDGSPLGIPFTTFPGGPCSASNPDMIQTAGIVPFRELGLNQNDILDGYYNPFTYVASYAAVVSNNAASAANAFQLNRTTIPAWLVGSPTPTQQNPLKQIFCGQQMSLSPPGPSVGIRVYDNTNLLHEVALTENMTNPIGTGFGNTVMAFIPNASADPGHIFNPATHEKINMDYMAYILISHGKNGAGAYILGKPKVTKIPAIASNTAEYQNTLRDVSNNYQFIDTDYSTLPGATYFDDIVLWRTQRGVMRELGNNSCVLP